MTLDNGKIIKVGDTESVTRVATEAITKSFAELTGDYNPIHFDTEYALNTPFKKCITHGLFCLGTISYVIGMLLPGEGSVFVNEKLDYKAPVYMGESITTSVEIKNIVEEKALVEVYIKCYNDSKVVLEGTSLLKMINKK